MSLERIEITPFAVIAGEILQERMNGSLTILAPPHRKILYWSQGELVLILSDSPADSLADFLVRREVITPEKGVELMKGDPTAVVARFHEAGLLDHSARQTLLREWVASQFLPLFSLDEGTSAYTEESPIDPEKRVFLQSTAALILEGIRSITNGLVLRRSLGDLKRDVAPARNSRFNIDSIALTEPERRVASSLTERQTIETFLKHFPTDSVTAAKVMIGMLSLGVFSVVEQRSDAPAIGFDDMQRDLELLAAIGSSDQRSLRAVALSRQLGTLDHYQIVDVPRAATRQQIIAQSEVAKRNFDPTTYPPIVRDAVQMINRRIDEAVNVLKDAGRRAAYDKMMQQGARGNDTTMQQRVQQRSIATQNFAKARDLSIAGDYFGAIILLKQAVEYAPDNAEAWFLLGSCQERNPKWKRDAAESFQMALSIDPNFVDAMISLGDVYKDQGLISRAQTCYEDVLKIAPENQQAQTRLKGLKKR